MIKPFLLSARTLGPPDFTPEASPRVCCQTPAAIRVCTWGLSTCEGPAEPGARGRCPTGSVCGFPGSPPGARGPLAWPLGAPGSCPSGDLVIVLRALSPVGPTAWPGSRHRRSRRGRQPAGHLDACVFLAPPRCPLPVRAECLGEAAGSLASHLCPWRDDSSPATGAYSLVGDEDWLPRAWDPRGIPVMMGERDTRVAAELQA